MIGARQKVTHSFVQVGFNLIVMKPQAIRNNLQHAISDDGLVYVGIGGQIENDRGDGLHQLEGAT